MAANANDLLQLVGTPGTATTLSTNYTAGNTSITVASTANWPTTTGVTFAMDEAETVNGEEVQVVGSYREFEGTVDTATSITNVDCVYGTDRDFSAGATTRVYIPVSAERENRLVQAMLQDHSNPNGNHKTLTDDNGNEWLERGQTTSAVNHVKVTNAATGNAPTIESTGSDTNVGLIIDTKGTGSLDLRANWQGYITNVLPSVSSVTENGNRSADITFASTVANLLTPGMKIRTTRAVAAPTYMGGTFNGTNHYFTKVTPTSTLSTVTDNFTMMIYAEPTAYQAGYMTGRADSTPNNAMGLKMESDGRVTVIVFNGAGNFRSVSTYQSLLLNKKTHVAATWASGTVVIYFDGISVPVATATTGGTAPTTAGTAGDFSIGRLGAFNAQYFAGYLSGAGVFNAVLPASTIKSYKNQALTGSETNCIGAWSLNNTGVNQQAVGTNDLTATSSVGYTVRNPYATDANGTSGGTYDYAIVQKVSTTTATVQYPEGCAIPTSGGISAVDIGVGNPFGFPMDKSRWQLVTHIRGNVMQTAVTTGTVYNPGGFYVSKPAGSFIENHYVFGGFSGTTDASKDCYFGLSTSNTAFSSGEEDATRGYSYLVVDIFRQQYVKDNLPFTSATATTYYTLFLGAGGGTLTNLGFSSSTPSTIVFTPAGI